MDQICFSKHRLNTFEDSIFKKNRRKCTPANVSLFVLFLIFFENF
jgi:hypothetical protein